MMRERGRDRERDKESSGLCQVTAWSAFIPLIKLSLVVRASPRDARATTGFALLCCLSLSLSLPDSKLSGDGPGHHRHFLGQVTGTSVLDCMRRGRAFINFDPALNIVLFPWW